MRTLTNQDSNQELVRLLLYRHRNQRRKVRPKKVITLCLSYHLVRSVCKNKYIITTNFTVNIF